MDMTGKPLFHQRPLPLGCDRLGLNTFIIRDLEVNELLDVEKDPYEMNNLVRGYWLQDNRLSMKRGSVQMVEGNQWSSNSSKDNQHQPERSYLQWQ
jgi:hypothetical protein